MKRTLATILLLGAATLPALAQETAGRARPTLMEGIISTIIFGVIGIVLAVLGFKVFDLAIKADIEKEIFEHKNMAAAMLAGSVVLGIALIVAATIHS
jgi:putative membrane protein